MFSQWPSWLSQSPQIRRIALRTWRVFLRVQRATLAKAVLVVRREDGRVLTFPSSSGALGLPTEELDGWRSVTTQVAEWLERLLQQKASPKLVGIVGAPGRQSITFVYCTTVAEPSVGSKGIWLDRLAATSILSITDRELLRLGLGNLTGWGRHVSG
jgi:hypothetical protein